jgi:multidrug resistance efflux pump
MVSYDEVVNQPEPSPPNTENAKENPLLRIRHHRLFWKGAILLLILLGISGVLVYNELQSTVYIEDSTITAPVITISPTNAGILEKIYVTEGDTVRRNQELARVNGVAIHSKIAGIITKIEDTPGMLVGTQTPVISMIDKEKLRVVGRIKEDKGLKDIHSGQQARFTVDAFPSEAFYGTVEKVAPIAREGDIVFSISDKRQEQEFEVTVEYDVDAYPDLKPGMSAKIWIIR